MLPSHGQCGTKMLVANFSPFWLWIRQSLDLNISLIRSRNWTCEYTTFIPNGRRTHSNHHPIDSINGSRRNSIQRFTYILHIPNRICVGQGDGGGDFAKWASKGVDTLEDPRFHEEGASWCADLTPLYLAPTIFSACWYAGRVGTFSTASWSGGGGRGKTIPACPCTWAWPRTSTTRVILFTMIFCDTRFDIYDKLFDICDTHCDTFLLLYNR